jgi:hypothetical protein
MQFVVNTWALLVVIVLSPSLQAEPGDTGSELALAEKFVDAFYSFDAENLQPLLFSAGESRAEMLFYQGWAEGGNYLVMKRTPCASVQPGMARCSITVQDDLVLALGIGFDVTDTFTISFEDGAISAVETSSNDPDRYHDAREWTQKNRSELIEPHCAGSDQGASDPYRCVQGMLLGYRDYARIHHLTPRDPSR